MCLGGGFSGGGLLVDFIVRLVVFANVSSVCSRGRDARCCSYLCRCIHSRRLFTFFAGKCYSSIVSPIVVFCTWEVEVVH